MEYPVLDAKKTGERIKELRKAHNLKVEQIASFMGFESVQAVYKWQRGDSIPTVDNLYALSYLFNTTVDDILRGEKERDESSSLPLCLESLSLIRNRIGKYISILKTKPVVNVFLYMICIECLSRRK
ncbi:MAG: helix-turn-helix domain-containing protein [Lachnospiraceae bacterium]|nr:helix-turn-helix domain-containing protein [Lachnospiraceae bacterium]